MGEGRWVSAAHWSAGRVETGVWGFSESVLKSKGRAGTVSHDFSPST